MDKFPVKPKIMGILNVTPDSFSDGGQFFESEDAVKQALKMVEEGADIIDIGGESTRPGADEVALDDELARVLPVIESLRRQSDVTISIDTSKSDVMRAAIDAGADMINDVTALRMKNALQTAAELNVPVCMMHMQGEPRTMQQSPQYENGPLQAVKTFLEDRIELAIEAGISKANLIVDPGFGFGKTLQHNCQILAGLAELKALRCPILVGLSRKSMIGQIANCDVSDRLAGSLAAAVVAVQNGAAILRVHDVRETVQAMAIIHACSSEEKPLQIID